jgi:hypothetical protein
MDACVGSREANDEWWHEKRALIHKCGEINEAGIQGTVILSVLQ